MRFTEIISETKPGLWANIHAKQDRIKHGSGEKMRKPGSKGAPTADALRKSATDEAANPAQQAAIAVNMKKQHQKPKGVAEGSLDASRTPDTDQILQHLTSGFRTLERHKDWYNDFSVITKIYSYLRSSLMKGDYEDFSNCYEDVLAKYPDAASELIEAMFESAGLDDRATIEDFFAKISEQGVAEGENWAKHNHKRVGGMSDKSVKSYRRSHPGSKIQTAVTTKPSKLKKGSKAAKRRASFCARMRGMKKHRTGAKTAHDPNSNINKSLRRWHCESIEELQELVMIAEQFIRNKKNEL